MFWTSEHHWLRFSLSRDVGFIHVHAFLSPYIPKIHSTKRSVDVAACHVPGAVLRPGSDTIGIPSPRALQPRGMSSAGGHTAGRAQGGVPPLQVPAQEKPREGLFNLADPTASDGNHAINI